MLFYTEKLQNHVRPYQLRCCPYSQISKDHFVFTEPLKSKQAKWLEELITSPNVWVELETEASIRANAVNPTSHPSTKDYMPVIIKNSTVNTVSQSEGLVKFNIDYMFSNKINTQSN